MKRDEYIKLRQENSGEIMYNFYKEFFNKEKHKNFLEFPQFIEFIQLWPLVQQAHNVSCEYYDVKFNVLKVPLNEGKMMFI